jgi:hypothetical protein
MEEHNNVRVVAPGIMCKLVQGSDHVFGFGERILNIIYN